MMPWLPRLRETAPRSQFNGKCHAIKLSADVHDDRRIAVIEVEACTTRYGPLDE